MLDSLTKQNTVIIDSLKKSRTVIDHMLSDELVQHSILKAVKIVVNCFKNCGKLLFAGNGGSAADAQHMSAEYVSRFMFDRPGLPSIALTTDTSALTAIGNDYGFEKLFSRQIQALGSKGDVFFAYSTSGTSANILKGLAEAKQRNISCIGMTGTRPQSKVMSNLCDVMIQIPSQETPYIQEGHLITGHLICLMVEQIIFKPEEHKS
jgi:D-sedoheptulose 7-phosphate isomerase